MLAFHLSFRQAAQTRMLAFRLSSRWIAQTKTLAFHLSFRQVAQTRKTILHPNPLGWLKASAFLMVALHYLARAFSYRHLP